MRWSWSGIALVLIGVAVSSCGSNGDGHRTADVDAIQKLSDVAEDVPGRADDVSRDEVDDADHKAADADSGTDADTHPGPPTRIVAVGDLHGDLEAARSAFRVAGVIDTSDKWIGGLAVVVQTGDVLDRWYLERELMDWMQALQFDARDAGGDIILLAGNHEDNNLEEYYPDVDPDSCAAYADLPDDTSLTSDSVSPECKKRAAALLPGGTYARKIARWKVAVILGDSVFVHGGLRPQYVSSPESIDDMNVRWSKFARGDAGSQVDEDIYETMWDRSYSDDDQEPDCTSLATVLASLGVSRMVVGHSRWGHINSACDGMVWRIDTGMSAYYNGTIEVLEITESTVTPLAE
jgi:hypothetical protein